VATVYDGVAQSNHTNLSYTFLATGVEKLTEQHQELTEDIHVDVFTKEEVRELLETGQIIQALHVAPLWKYFFIHGNGCADGDSVARVR